MKKILLKSNSSLRTALWTALIVALIGVSACSNEIEEADVDSGEVVAVDQVESVAEDNNSEGTTITQDMPESSNDAGIDKTATDSVENTNSDKTAADGLQ
ncbi:hypothetical protein [Psychrobacter sp. S1-30-MNA-CIBAN-0213]|uniref:hypothetical protein n=1 Tax=unclassified Psychrobacter TaxID=196806 RepID=UPI0033212A2F